MKREFLKAMEISDEVIDKIMSENGKDIESTKAKFADYEEVKSKLTEYEKTVEELKGKASNAEQVNAELEKLKNELKSREEQTAKELKDKQLTENIKGVFGDKKFVNEYTENALISQIKAELEKPENAGKGVSDLFTALTTDKEGIFANDTTPPPNMGGAGSDGKITGDPDKMDYNTYKLWRSQQE